MADNASAKTETETNSDGYRPILAVDLGAVCENFKKLSPQKAGAKTGAVIKANAYGIGMVPVAQALAGRADCETFFVAYPHEGVEARNALKDVAPDAKIYVLSGPTVSTVRDFAPHQLTPVLNSLEQCRIWAETHANTPAALHVDTGMHRLGAPQSELIAIKAIDDLKIELLMTHLACADDPNAKENEAQRSLFSKLKKHFPDAADSIAATGGALLGPAFETDLARLGVGLYGVDPSGRGAGDLKPALTLTARVLQVQDLEPGDRVGYNGTFQATRPTRIATLAIGYADGYPVAASNKVEVFVGGARAPLVGRVSMDLVTIDVSNAPEAVRPGDMAELFGPHLPIAELARWCDTIPYELLTRLADRVVRRYEN